MTLPLEGLTVLDLSRLLPGGFCSLLLADFGADGPNNWGVIGISRDQWMLVAAALTLGGNVRVGLEDNFYLPNGEMARSNGELIAKARQMTEDAGRRPATVQEARALLAIAEPVKT